jgi:hypothetical protein
MKEKLDKVDFESNKISVILKIVSRWMALSVQYPGLARPLIIGSNGMKISHPHSLESFKSGWAGNNFF